MLAIILFLNFPSFSQRRASTCNVKTRLILNVIIFRGGEIGFEFPVQRALSKLARRHGNATSSHSAARNDDSSARLESSCVPDLPSATAANLSTSAGIEVFQKNFNLIKI